MPPQSNIEELVSICKEFVNRVEKGEIKSWYTYNRMKNVLDKMNNDGVSEVSKED